MMIIIYTNTKNTVILPKTKVKKKMKAEGNRPLERNLIEENRKNTDERVKFLQGPFKFPLTYFSGL